MGSVCSYEQIRNQVDVNKQIEKNIEKERRDELGNQKLLILGTGECGKSTILKQMQILHNNGFTEAEYTEKKTIVYSNVVTFMAILIQAMKSLDVHFDSLTTEKEAQLVLRINDSEKNGDPLTDDVADGLVSLWKDAKVKRTFERRAEFHEFQLPDSAKYFFDNVSRIRTRDYRPTEQDILMTRVPTVGVVQVKFHIKGCLFRVFDVGGQRSERRKWIHLFDDVNGIIFLSAISEYNQVLVEDPETNRLQESLDLFSQICNSRWFHSAAMILFLNKTDLFREKLKKTPITTLFTNYKGKDNDYDSAIVYIKTAFECLNEIQRKVYIHETCATETDQVSKVINSVIDTVIEKNLQGAGLLKV